MAEDQERGPLLPTVVAAVVAFALLAVGLGWADLTGGPKVAPLPPRVLVASTARVWLRAWERGDTAALARLTTEPAPGLQPSVRAFGDGLGTAALTARPRRGRIVEDQATVPFDVAIDLAGLGTWRYEGRLALTNTKRDGDDGKRWRVAWSPAVLHPALTPSTRVQRVLTWPTRAPLLAGDGTPLAESRFSALAGRLGPAGATAAAAFGRCTGRATWWVCRGCRPSWSLAWPARRPPRCGWSKARG